MDNQDYDTQRRMALVGILSGDKALAPAGKALLDSLEQQRPSSIGNGFLVDRGGNVAQDPAYAQFLQAQEDAKQRWQREQQKDIDDRQDRREASASDRQDKRDTNALTRVTAGIDAREQAAKAATDKANSAKYEREAQWLAKQRSTTGLDELEQSTNDLDKAIQPYVQQNQPVPGVGGLQNIGKVANLSPEGRQIHAKYAAVRDSILKARSGGAVTDGEADRLLEELGQSVMFSNKDFLTNWQSVRARIAAKVGNLEAGVSPEAADLYRQRYGAVTGAPATASSPTPSPTQRTLNGKNYEKRDGQWYEVTPNGQ